MEDKDIIILLEKIINEKLLGETFIQQVEMCLGYFKSNNSDKYSIMNKSNARNLAINLIKKAGLISTEKNTETTNVDEEFKNALKRRKKIIKEIGEYLSKGNLEDVLLRRLEEFFKRLNKENISLPELSILFLEYENIYKPAIDAINEYITNASNHGRH